MCPDLKAGLCQESAFLPGVKSTGLGQQSLHQKSISKGPKRTSGLVKDASQRGNRRNLGDEILKKPLFLYAFISVHMGFSALYCDSQLKGDSGQNTINSCLQTLRVLLSTSLSLLPR